MKSDFNLAGDDVAAARESMQRELRDGERLLWVGVAAKRRLDSSAYLFLSFGLIFLAGCALVVFKSSWIYGSGKNRNAAAIVFIVFMTPFFLAGFRMMAAPWLARRKARKNIYAITDQRAIVITGSLLGSTTEVRSFTADQLKDIRRVQREDGSGDLVFEDQLNLPGFGNFGAGFKDHSGGGHANRFVKPFGFIGVERVREVEITLRDSLKLDRIASSEEPQSL